MKTVAIRCCVVILAVASWGSCSDVGEPWQQACDLRNMTYICEGKNPAKVIGSLPPNTTGLVYFFSGVFIDTGLKFKHLPLLEYLELTTQDLRQYKYHGELVSEDIFSGLVNLKHLAIHVSLGLLNPKVLLGLSGLVSLDLSYTRHLGIKQVSKILELLGDSGLKLRTLNLTNIQYPSPTGPLRTVDLRKQILCKVSKLPLMELDVSWNGLILFTPGLVEKTPDLRHLRSRGNIHGVTEGYHACCLLDVLLHPSLQHLELGNDEFEYFDPTNHMIWQKWTRDNRRKRRHSIFQQKGGDYRNSRRISRTGTAKVAATSNGTAYGHCLNEAIVHLNNATCVFINCVCEGYTGIPCKYIPSLSRLVVPHGEDCTLPFYVPVSPSLTTVLYKNAQRDIYESAVLLSGEKPGSICFLPSNNVKEFDISGNKFGQFLQLGRAPFKGLMKLEKFNLEDNSIEFDGNSTLLQNKTSVKVLNANNNRFLLHLDTENTMFENDADLEVLTLGKCEIQKIPRQEFAALHKLRFLDVSYNELPDFDVNISTMNNLSFLNLSHNRIAFLPEHVTSHLDKIAPSNSPIIDLMSNPLMCQCNIANLIFLEWIKHPSVKIAGFDLLLCTHPSGGRVALKDLNLEELHSYCFPSHVTLITATVLATSGFFLVIFLIIISYRRRWTIRYWLHAARQVWEKERTRTTGGEHRYRFDAFVVYSTEDRLWVHDNLLPTLEGQHGKKLCLHCRNFIPGRYIEDAIWESITSSYKSILVLTPNFLASRWCEEEFRMARQASQEERRDVIVLVLLKPLPTSGLPRPLREMLQERNYMEWTDDMDGQRLFWDRLVTALN